MFTDWKLCVSDPVIRGNGLVVVDHQQVRACFDWALAGAPWKALLLQQVDGAPQELDADGFAALADRHASTAVLLNGGRSAHRPTRFFILPEQACAQHNRAANAYRSRLKTALLSAAPRQVERAVVLKQLCRARWFGRRHRWQALHVPTAPLATPLAAPTAFIVGLHWLALGGAEGFALDCIALAHQTGRPVFVLCEYPSDSFYPLPEAVQVLPLYVLPERLRFDLIELLVRAHPGSLVHIHHCPSLYRALPRLRWGLDEQPRVIDSFHINEVEDGSADSKSGYGSVSGWRRAIASSAVMSCITACRPSRIEPNPARRSRFMAAVRSVAMTLAPFPR